MALARRNVLEPLVEPEYEFEDVPYCNRSDLRADSVVYRIDSREKWLELLPELLLVCNEATLRAALRMKNNVKVEVKSEFKTEKHVQNNANTESFDSKPLSLEYIADRLDLDDPLYGYIVRDKKTGWLQGFITVSTLTTWQKWFRWDSLADEAGVLKFEDTGKGLDALQELGIPLAAKNDESVKHNRDWWFERLVDADGSLAATLNSELRDGDTEAEGVIWPRIAELSLLGALGCGSYLVDLVVEDMKKKKSPYHYIVLQSTENSVPFYEKKGFVRVGAVARYFSPETRKKRRETLQKYQYLESPRKLKSVDRFELGEHLEFKSQAIAAGSKQIPESMRLKGPSSPYYWIKINNEHTKTLLDVAKEVNVDIFDLIFFNRRIYSDLSPNAKLKNHQLIRVPLYPKGFDPLRKTKQELSVPLKMFETLPMVGGTRKKGKVSENGLWYCSKEDDTPTIIANKLKLNAEDIVKENKVKYKNLEIKSKLVPRTMIRIPNVRPSIINLPVQSIDKIANNKSIINVESNITLRDQIQQDWGFFELTEEDTSEMLSAPMCYRHWAFTDDPVDVTHASYMMVKVIDKLKPCKTEKFSKGNVNGNDIIVNCFAYTDEGKVFQNTPTEKQQQEKAMSKIKKAEFEKLIKLELEKAEVASSNILGSRRKRKTVSKFTYTPEEREAKRLKRVSKKKSLPLPVEPTPKVKPRKKSLAKCTISLPNDKHIVLRVVSEQLKRKSKRIEIGPFTGRVKDKLVKFKVAGAPFNIPLFARVPLKMKWPKLSGLSKIEELLYKYAAPNLFNKVVKVVPKRSTEARKKQLSKTVELADFYYVITYIPDLQWVRLAPLKRNGFFPLDHKFCPGKPCWTCIPEGEGLEIDISASRVFVVPSKATERSSDADKEKWFIDI